MSKLQIQGIYNNFYHSIQCDESFCCYYLSVLYTISFHTFINLKAADSRYCFEKGLLNVVNMFNDQVFLWLNKNLSSK